MTRVARPRAGLVLGCLVVAALTLLAPSAPTYDPMSWVIWGREVAHGALQTTGGPSWKPLPMLFTTPFALLGDSLAPDLWLLVARAGGLLGVVMGFRLAARLAGPFAGTITAVAILASEGYVYGAWRGNSEGLLVGLALWAVERHLDGRRTTAFVLGLAAALLRPEVWPLWGLYGLWLLVRERGPGRTRVRAVVLAGFALIPLAWFAPEYLGSGDLLRAASRARTPNLDSPAYAAFPAAEVLRASFATLPLVVGVGALLALWTALLRRTAEHDHVALVLGGAAGALLLAVAAMTQVGFSGNLRYVVLPLAFVAVLAGAGWVEAVRAARRRAGRPLAAALTLVVVAGAALSVGSDASLWRREVLSANLEAESTADLARVLRRAGGAAAINACRRVYATRFEVPVVAWSLHRHLSDVQIFAIPPGATLALRGSALSRDPRFAPVAVTRRWVAGRACPAPNPS